MTQREEEREKKNVRVRVRRISAHTHGSSSSSSTAPRGDEGCVWEVVVCMCGRVRERGNEGGGKLIQKSGGGVGHDGDGRRRRRWHKPVR